MLATIHLILVTLLYVGKLNSTNNHLKEITQKRQVGLCASSPSVQQHVHTTVRMTEKKYIIGLRHKVQSHHGYSSISC